MQVTQKIKCCVLAAAMIVFISGCNFIKYSYTYEQSLDNATKVEICRYDYDTKSVKVIDELDLDVASALLSDIASLDCYRPFGDHARSYGEIVIYITYANGEAEVIGMVNSATVDLNGEWHMKAYYYDYAQWCAVIIKYVDRQLVPELEPYLE